jgi:hypothetical protein
VSALADGTYDALVVDVDAVDEHTARVELVITSGARKGEVVGVRASGLTEDPISLLGIPASIRVVAGEVSVTFEP